MLQNTPNEESTARVEALEDAFVELLLLLSKEDSALRPKLLGMFDTLEADFLGMKKERTASAVATLRESFRHG